MHRESEKKTRQDQNGKASLLKNQHLQLFITIDGYCAAAMIVLL
jgi:hypothetical protein